MSETGSETLVELQRIQRRTAARIAQLQEQLRQEVSPTGGEDYPDANEIYEKEAAAVLVRTLEAKQHALERAIAMAAAGQYGVCEQCGRPIPDERLRIMPETTVCVQCAGEIERRNRVGNGRS